MIRIISRVICICGLFIAFPLLASAQNAPVTTCSSVSVSAPGTVAIPVTVINFNNIVAVSLKIDYDFSVIQYIQATPHPQLSGFAFGDMDLGNGMHRLSMGWYGPSTTLPDGSAILTFSFNYTAGTTPLIWFDSGPSCEYMNDDFIVLNDIPTSAYYINGLVCGSPVNPGQITGDDQVCVGQAGLVYSINPVTNAQGYFWTAPPGAVIVNGQNTNSILVDYPENSISGNIEVYAFNDCGNGPASELAVIVNSLPIANAGDDFSINYGTSTTLQAAPGGTGTYSYHWSPEELLVNPNVQNPQTVILTSTTLFTLLVTNLESLCQNTDEVVVTVTGGPLNVNPLALPNNICSGESSQLYANAGGGSGNYTYLWTCLPPDSPPWTSNQPNPTVSPDSSKIYQVLVNDGFTNTNGQTALQVNQVPTATISGGDTLCGTGLTTVLTVTLTGTPPWNFTYSYGNASVFVYQQLTSPYYIIAGDPGIYTVTYLEDANCTGITFGSAVVAVFPVPAPPQISIQGVVLTSNTCCGNQWYMDGTLIPGATNQSFTATQSGAYFDIVTLNSCSSEPSDTIDVTVGIGEFDIMKVTIYPNPADDNVTIQFTSSNHLPERINLFSSDARLIFRSESFEHTGYSSFMLDVGDLCPGLYILETVTSGYSIFNKLVIK
jgi:hypothetical protein